MKRKVLITAFATGVLATSSQLPTSAIEVEGPVSSTQRLHFTNVKDAFPFTVYTPLDDGNYGVNTQNLLINQQTREVQEITLTNGDFNELSSHLPLQRYKDRVIMSGTGKTIELVQEDDENIKVNEYDFNVLFYDENEKKYVTYETPTFDDLQAPEEAPIILPFGDFHVLNDQLEEVDFIPAPEEMKDGFEGYGQIEVYNLDTIIYIGDSNGKQFQVKKYDLATKSWQTFAELLPQESYEGYRGHAEMSYVDSHPDWVAFKVDTLISDEYIKTSNERIKVRLDERELVERNRPETGNLSDEEIEKLKAEKDAFWDKFEAEIQAYDAEALANNQLKKIDKVYFVNTKTGEVKEDTLPVEVDMILLSSPNMNAVVTYNRDGVTVIDMDPAGIKVLATLSADDLFPSRVESDFKRVNKVLAYDVEQLILSTPNGLLKYNMVTQESEYLYELPTTLEER
jgi:hypothetical protein